MRAYNQNFNAWVDIVNRAVVDEDVHRFRKMGRKVAKTFYAIYDHKSFDYMEGAIKIVGGAIAGTAVVAAVGIAGPLGLFVGGIIVGNGVAILNAIEDEMKQKYRAASAETAMSNWGKGSQTTRQNLRRVCLAAEDLAEDHEANLIQMEGCIQQLRTFKFINPRSGTVDVTDEKSLAMLAQAVFAYQYSAAKASTSAAQIENVIKFTQSHVTTLKNNFETAKNEIERKVKDDLLQINAPVAPATAPRPKFDHQKNCLGATWTGGTRSYCCYGPQIDQSGNFIEAPAKPLKGSWFLDSLV